MLVWVLLNKEPCSQCKLVKADSKEGRRLMNQEWAQRSISWRPSWCQKKIIIWKIDQASWNVMNFDRRAEVLSRMMTKLWVWPQDCVTKLTNSSTFSFWTMVPPSCLMQYSRCSLAFTHVVIPLILSIFCTLTRVILLKCKSPLSLV